MFAKFLPTLVRSLLSVSLLALSLLSAPPLQAAPPLVPPLAPAAPGDLDTGFAGFGVEGRTAISGLAVTDLAVQPDGKLLVVGVRPAAFDLAVYRLLPNGAWDQTFNEDGAALFPNLFAAVSVALQSDGRIVVGGTVGDEFALARLTPGGALDPAFGNQGVSIDVDFELEELHAILVQPDDKIVAVGLGHPLANSTDDRFGIARYNPSGSRDSTFGGGDGKTLVDFDGADRANAVALSGDKLVVVGRSYPDGFAIARLHPDGMPDASFHQDGKLVADFDSADWYEEAFAVAVTDTGRIVVAGYGHSGTGYVARFLSSGAPDTTFNATGRLAFPGDDLTHLALQPAGQLLALAMRRASNQYDLALHRFTSGGQVDETFGYNNGIIIGNFGFNERPRRVVVLPDGRLLVAGTVDGDGLLMRLWPNGASFDSGGAQAHAIVAGIVYPAGSDEYANALAQQPDGRLLVAGEVRHPNNTWSHAAVTRFLPTGQVDAAFGQHGTALVSPPGSVFSGARAVAVQPDGKVVLAGYTRGSGVGADLFIARLTAAGVADTTFASSSGTLRVDYGAGHDEVFALAFTPPDPATGEVKIVVVGNAYYGAGGYAVWVVTRLNADGQPDPTFGPDGTGTAFLDFSSRCGACPVAPYAVVVQPDGGVVVGGHVNFDTALARLTPGGLPDTTFGTQGLNIQDLGGNDGLNALVLAPDGQLYGAGSNAPDGHNNFIVTAFDPGGELVDQGSADWSAGSDIAYALDWRADGQLLAGGFSDGKFAWAQFSALDLSAGPLKAATDLVGTYEVGTGVQFAGDDQVVVAGWQEYQGDWNFALARFQTTPLARPEPPPVYTLFFPWVQR